VGSFKHYRDIVIVVLLLALPFFFLRSSIRRPEDTSWVDRTLLHVAAPFQYFAALLARGVSSLVGDYVYLVDVKADNNRLAYENANLRSKVSDSERTEADNRRLRRLLGLRETLFLAIGGLLIGPAYGLLAAPLRRVREMPTEPG